MCTTALVFIFSAAHQCLHLKESAVLRNRVQLVCILIQNAAHSNCRMGTIVRCVRSN